MSEAAEVSREMFRKACLWARIVWVFFVLVQWNNLPGPWWCKALQFAALQLILGGFDEVLYMGLLWVIRYAVRMVRSRKPVQS
jgi:hypothetical protein